MYASNETLSQLLCIIAYAHVLPSMCVGVGYRCYVYSKQSIYSLSNKVNVQ